MAATSSQGEENATLWMWLLEKGEEGSEEDREEGGAWEKLWGCAARQVMEAGQEENEEEAFVSHTHTIYPSLGPGAGAGLVKAVLVQARYGAAELEAALAKEAALGRSAALICFPEGWNPEPFRAGVNAPLLERLLRFSALYDSLACWGTSTEYADETNYVTSLVTLRDQVIGRYRKRCPVYEGTHGSGKESAAFPISGDHPLAGSSASALLCFDIENEPAVLEALALGPRVLFNPSHIPPPPRADPASATVARETNSRQYEYRVLENPNLCILKTDFPPPTGFAQTLAMDQGITRYSGFTTGCLAHYMHADPNSPLAKLHRNPPFVASSRPRTERRDNIGNRVSTRQMSAHTAAVFNFSASPTKGGFQRNTTAISCSKHEAILWNPITGTELLRVTPHHFPSPSHLCFTACSLNAKGVASVATQHYQAVELDHRAASQRTRFQLVC